MSQASVADIVSGVFERLCSEPIEDDPQGEGGFHWYRNEDDPIEDSNGDSEPMPTTIRRCRNFSIRSCSINQSYRERDLEIDTFTLSNSWINWIHQLCHYTRTLPGESYTVTGTQNAIQIIQNKRLHDQYIKAGSGSKPSLVGPEASALVFAVWLMVCFRIANNQMPQGICASDLCGSLRESLLVVFGKQTSRTTLFDYIRFWEWTLCSRYPTWMSCLEDIAFTGEFPVPQDPDGCKKERLQALDLPTGPVSLARMILNKDIANGKTLMSTVSQDPVSYGWLMNEAIQLFVSFSPEVLRSCIQGRTARHGCTVGHPTRTELELNAKETGKSVIYLSTLTDKSGIPFSPVLMKKMCEIAHNYVAMDDSYNEMARQIDRLIHCPSSWTENLTASGFRRYVDYRQVAIKKDRSIRDASRRAIVVDFVENLRKKIAIEERADRKFAPMSDALVEIGFTKTPEKRPREHRMHHNSNYLMNLFQAIAEYLWPGTFVLQQHILHVCWAPTHPWLGEILLTELCDGYTARGGGFSHYPAGRSNGSAYRSSEISLWHQWMSWAHQRFNIINRLQEYNRIGEEQKRLKNSSMAALEKERKRQHQAIRSEVTKATQEMKQSKFMGILIDDYSQLSIFETR